MFVCLLWHDLLLIRHVCMYVYTGVRMLALQYCRQYDMRFCNHMDYILVYNVIYTYIFVFVYTEIYFCK